MSKKLRLAKNPSDYPNLYVRVPSGQVRKGDIFQGTKNKTKWYASEGGSGVDSWRTYFRLKSKAKGSLKVKPDKPEKLQPARRIKAPSGKILREIKGARVKAATGVLKDSDSIRMVLKDVPTVLKGSVLRGLAEKAAKEGSLKISAG